MCEGMALLVLLGLMQGKLQKAAGMVWELLQPLNARFEKIDVVPGGSVRLTVQRHRSSKAAQSSAMVSGGAAGGGAVIGL